MDASEDETPFIHLMTLNWSWLGKSCFVLCSLRMEHFQVGSGTHENIVLRQFCPATRDEGLCQLVQVDVVA